MWFQELGEFYDKNVFTEAWNGVGSIESSNKNPKGVKAPDLARPGLSYRNVKMGTKEPNMSAGSVAGNVQFGNPYEQEEEVSGSVQIQGVLNMINELEGELDGSDNADRVALMVLGKLKNTLL